MHPPSGRIPKAGPSERTGGTLQTEGKCTEGNRPALDRTQDRWSEDPPAWRSSSTLYPPSLKLLGCEDPVSPCGSVSGQPSCCRASARLPSGVTSSDAFPIDLPRGWRLPLPRRWIRAGNRQVVEASESGERLVARVRLFSMALLALIQLTPLLELDSVPARVAFPSQDAVVGGSLTGAGLPSSSS